MQKSKFKLYHMTHKFDSGIHDLAVYKYSNFGFVYDLHILDSSGCPGEKGRTFRKSKMLLGPFLDPK